jgi:predicted nucleic acid-binding protein
MIILDTNVVSEPTKPEADPIVIEWLDRQSPETLYLTTVNLAELLEGIALMPAGRRKTIYAPPSQDCWTGFSARAPCRSI